MKLKHLLFAMLLGLCMQTSFGQFTSNSFSSQVNFGAASNTHGITYADLNNDGKPEFITTKNAPNGIGIFPNTSTVGTINSSTFAACITLTTIASASSNPLSVEAVDLTGDGKPEIIVGYSGGGSNFSVFVNQYNGIVFNSSSFTRIDIPCTNDPFGITTGDYDSDGKTDIAVVFTGGSVAVYRNTTSGGTLSVASPLTLAAGSVSIIPVTGDLDNDGKADLVIANSSGSSLTVYRNTSSSIGSISFSLVGASVNSLSTLSFPTWPEIADIDNNGTKDIIFANDGSNTLSIYPGMSTTSISYGSRIDIATTPYTHPQSTIIADFDNDGKKDIAVSVEISGAGYILLKKNQHVSGTITASSFSAFTSYAVNGDSHGIAAVDFDSDQRPDMASGSINTLNISVLKNRLLATEPTIQASNLTVSNTPTAITLNFTKGNGSKRLIVARTNSNTSVAPNDTSFYTQNSVFGNGTNMGSNNYVVYADTGSSVTITGLTYGQTYNFTIYEYNGIGGYSNYLTSSPASITQVMGDVFYSKSSGALNLVGTWGSNTDGSGNSPASFNLANTTFIVANNVAPTLTANWIITGTNAFLIVGDGLNALNFTIPAGYSIFLDSLVIRANATLTFMGGITANKAFFDTLSIAQFVSGTAQNIPGFNYYILTVAGSIKTITDNCYVRSTLNLLCNINTGAYTLTLGTSGIQPGILNQSTGGNITGRFKRWFAAGTNSGITGLFPMQAGINYRPATVEFTSAPVTAGTLTTTFFNVVPGNSGLPQYDFSTSPLVNVNKVSNSGYWKIESNGLTGGIYSLTLTGTGFYGIGNYTLLRMVKRQTAGAWTSFAGTTAIPGTGSNAAPTVGRSGYSGFGEFSIAGDSADNPLPVTWLSFEGVKNAEGIQLIWKTTREINNAYFLLERKTETQNDFIPIAKVFPFKEGSIKSYTFLDQTDFKNELLTYRIKQVDLDGKFNHSKSVLIFAEVDYTDLVIGPNPARDYIVVKNYKTGEFIELIDALGKTFLIIPEDNKVKLNGIPPGIYLLNITHLNGERKSVKIVKE